MPKCMFTLNKVEKMEDDDKALKVSLTLLNLYYRTWIYYSLILTVPLVF